MKPRTGVLAALLLCLPFAISAAGAGGVFFGLAQPALRPGFLPPVDPAIAHAEFMGGQGYGVTSDGFIIGGFGLAFLDYDIYSSDGWLLAGGTATEHLAGGAGGLVLGRRIIGTEGLHLDLGARLGLGGMAYMKLADTAYGRGWPTWGYAIAYAEPYAELGLGLLPWLHLTAVLSYPALGNFVPGKPFSDLALASPALAFAFQFGKFD